MSTVDLSGNTVKLWKSEVVEGLELKRAFLKNFTFSRHMDDRYVICLVQRGVELFRCGGISYAATPGDIILYHPEDVHDGGSIDQKPWAYRCFYVTEAQVRSTSAGDSELGPLPFFPEKVIRDPSLAGRLSALHRLMETHEDTLPVQTAFVELFSRLVSCHSRQAGSGKIHRRFHARASLLRSRDFLEGHFAESTALGRLAALAGLSPFHFLREFKRYFGMPPHEYQKQLRVRRAKDLLAQGLPPADVAAEAGFSDQSHLSRVFRGFTGITPGRFRP
ncbi:MAG: AraC family transcriptional regulator [Acidobacteriota bacterium]